jgi:hypothetical protein
MNPVLIALAIMRCGPRTLQTDSTCPSRTPPEQIGLRDLIISAASGLGYAIG